VTFDQPYVGITPLPADGFPLVLDDSNLPLRLMIRVLMREMNSALLSARTPHQEEIYRRMQEVRPGDLVIERSTAYRRTLDATLGGFGVLLAKRHEWETTDGEYAKLVAEKDAACIAIGEEPDPLEEHARNRMTDTAWYVQYGPAPKDIYRWVNAECIALPLSLDDLVEAKKEWP
jgi:hypothetical protein